MSSIFTWMGLFLIVAGPILGVPSTVDIVGAILMGIGIVLMIVGR